MLENFSRQAVKIVENAKKIANELNNNCKGFDNHIGTEHLLLAMYQINDSICHFLLNEQAISYQELINTLNQMLILRKGNGGYTLEFQEIIQEATEFAKSVKSEYVFDEHLFYCLLTAKNNVAKTILISLELDINELLSDMDDIFDFNAKSNESTLPYLTNLSQLKKSHPYISRSNHIERLQIIMNKKQKNNPMLIGSAGVGKTAVVEGLTEVLTNEVIYRLDLGTIISGTKYRGELEEKIVQVMNFIKEKNAILFIDEIHNIVGAGSNEGSLDIANILKPYLARSDIRCIGATTLDEYYRFIEKDKALLRRFQNVYIDEPSADETFNILSKIKYAYEDYHKVEYQEEEVKYIIEAALRYLPTRTFPDKAIDILDEIGAYCKMYPGSHDISSLTKKVIFAMTGINCLTIDELNNLDLNFFELKVYYQRFIEMKKISNNIVTIEVKKDFEISKLKEDLYRVFSLKEDAYLEIDLENYYEPTTINNLIGSNKGYVGYDTGGILSEHVLKHPMSLIYIKNVNNAHITIQSFIKKILKSPNFIDNKGRKIILSNVIFVVESFDITTKPLGIASNTKQKQDKLVDIYLY